MKAYLFFFFFCSLFLFSSCKEGANSYSFRSSSAPKPQSTVAIVPVIDNTVHSFSWSLSEEFSSEICNRLTKKDAFTLLDAQKVHSMVKKLDSKKEDPFGMDISWIKKSFSDSDFVVFLELVEHEEVSSTTPASHITHAADSSAALNMSMRLRIVDIRREKPQIILQELLHDTHHIPRAFNQTNFYQFPWKSDNFSISPLGMAHAHFTKEISSHIEDYILFALTHR